MTEPPPPDPATVIIPPAREPAARGWLLGLSIVVYTVGAGMSFFGLIAWAFGAPIDPGATALLALGSCVIMLIVLILGFVLSRRGRWWIALVSLVLQIAGWIVAQNLIIDIGLNP